MTIYQLTTKLRNNKVYKSYYQGTKGKKLALEIFNENTKNANEKIFSIVG